MDITLHKIFDLIWRNDISEIDFCNDIGINKSAVTDWKKGKTKSYMRHLSKISKHFDVTVDYLKNKSDIFILEQSSDIEKELLYIYNNLNEEGKNKIIENARDIALIDKYKKSTSNEVDKMQA